MTMTATAPEPSRRMSSRSNLGAPACVDRVGDEFGGDRLGVLGVVAEVVVGECGPDVEARHLHRVRGTRQRERDQ